MQAHCIFARLSLTWASPQTVPHHHEEALRQDSGSYDKRTGILELRATRHWMNRATTSEYTAHMHSRSIHMDNLTSNGIERMRKDMLLRTCADGFPFSRYAHQSTLAS